MARLTERLGETLDRDLDDSPRDLRETHDARTLLGDRDLDDRDGSRSI